MTQFLICPVEYIVADLDLLTRLALISTCRFFRELTMTQPFFFEELVLKIEKDKCQINIGDGICGRRVTYTKDGNGCIKASVRNGKQLIEGVSHWKQAAIDAKKTLQLPNLHIKRLHIALVLDDPTAFHMATRDFGLLPFGAIINGVRAKTEGTHLLQVERLSVRYYLEHLQKILLSLTPGYLKSIYIIFWPLQHRQIDNKVQYDAMTKVVETEQWKQAEEFTTNLPFTGSLHHLYHFKKFDVRYPDLSIENFRQMEEFLIKSPNFEKSICGTRKSAVDTIKQESKEVRPYYQIPHHTEKYFIIDFQSDARLFYINFTKNEQSQCFISLFYNYIK